ncbi:MAG: sigma-70 family RNA polymerase sigma factor [Solobacterium sp.]|nr:sigma-70 family RNA polymerase sigma factor [Solobacterium sp.]
MCFKYEQETEYDYLVGSDGNMSLSFAEIRTRKILDTYGDSLFRVACMYLHNEADAEEVVQDTIIQLLRYDPEFDTDSQEKGWLMKTCANLCRNRLRVYKAHPSEEIDERIAARQDADLSFVWDAVNALPVKYREIIHLFYQEGYSTAEIAKIVSRREGSVRSDLTRARKQLKEILKEAYDFE